MIYAGDGRSSCIAYRRKLRCCDLELQPEPRPQFVAHILCSPDRFHPDNVWKFNIMRLRQPVNSMQKRSMEFKTARNFILGVMN